MAKDESSPARSPGLEDAESLSSAPPQPKRTAPTETTESAPRMKRGKYTSLACNECKRRKLKCLPIADGDSCERCNARKLQNQQIQLLGDELAQVRHELANLSQAVLELRQHRSPAHAAAVQGRASSHTDLSLTQSPSGAALSKDAVPKHPQFVGPTRPAYGLMIAERSLTRMGIPDSPSSPSGGSGPASPDAPAPHAVADPAAAAVAVDVEFWAQCSPAEAARLMGVFEEEAESVYPYIDILELAARSEQILRIVRQPELLEEEALAGSSTGRALTTTDIDLAKIAVAIGVAIEARGKNDLCAAIAASVEQHTARISQTEVSLRGIQLLISLSIYYFHSDDELLAWRTIGVAAREALEMGLHRKRSLYDNFADPAARQRALRVFCCCYILDRRWSFGTGLSFALVDGDIDSTLLESELDSPYLKCMVGYARLCSKLWEAIPPFGAPSQSIPHELAYALDASALEWLDSIPPHLQMRHYPRGAGSQGNAGTYTSSVRPPPQQPRVLHRLRALLYLRGNLTRISIYQHHLVSPAAVAADPQRARVAVDLARDTVQVLVHLNATSDIYSRQQNAFNYFLASAFAVISLALCHAPHMFAAQCTQSFMDAAGLVKGFSRHSMASKRLWKSIRGLSPRLKSLGVGGGASTKEQQQQQQTGGGGANAAGRGAAASSEQGAARWRGYGQFYPGDGRQQAGSSSQQAPAADSLWNYSLKQPSAGGAGGAGGSGSSNNNNSNNNNNTEPLPGMNPDILSLFDSLGDEAMFSSGSFDTSIYGGMEPDADGGDISRLFLQGLM
ncbi:Casein kinase II, regulatory subunit [Akanthomyces lecanii RCEF 1005]|uniref:Casein kinase II, regulatory subunit n=1 Tax=Akanthomyces lecanii RCEF 1005 TaxID=1081108 RepID=A0A168F4M0_CORDF|nr:Casein kinase II, regulatory subunit [Akanthomyces lecanii RCEF 1005]